MNIVIPPIWLQPKAVHELPPKKKLHDAPSPSIVKIFTKHETYTQTHNTHMRIYRRD